MEVNWHSIWPRSYLSLVSGGNYAYSILKTARFGFILVTVTLGGCDFYKSSGANFNSEPIDQSQRDPALQHGELTRTVEDIKQGASKGDAASQFQLGMLYEQGKGVPQDIGQAASLYSAAARQNYPSAMMNLASLYFRGEGISQDYVKAADLYRKLVDMSYKPARLSLALMYSDGIGLEKDESKAVALLKLAASDGDVQAMTNLGLLYQQGRGAPKDDIEALALWVAAAAHGDVFASQNKAALAAKLSPEQVKRAEELGQQYAAKAQTAKNK